MYINLVVSVNYGTFLCDQRSQRYIFEANNTTVAIACPLFFIFFRKKCEKNLLKLARNINCLYICNDFKNEIFKTKQNRATRAELREELVKAGIRPSVQRLAIFEYVRQSCEHPTAEVVYEALCDELGSLSLTTVYNTLKLFVDAGLISMLTIDDTFRCFDGNRCCHAHFRCDRCGRIVDLQMKKDFLSLVEGLDAYSINDAQLYLKGLCPVCKNKK